MTPTIPFSPAHSWSTISLATSVWLLWSLRELPREEKSTNDGRARRAWDSADLGGRGYMLTMWAIDHGNSPLVLLSQRIFRGVNAGRILVDSLAAPSENDERVRAPCRLYNRSQPLLRHAKEMVLRGRGAQNIHGNGDTSIGSVLKANEEG